VHDNSKLPIRSLGRLSGTLATGRVLDYRDKGDENRKLCSLHLSLMDAFACEKPVRFSGALPLRAVDPGGLALPSTW
jgi:hypothetical protein